MTFAFVPQPVVVAGRFPSATEVARLNESHLKNFEINVEVAG